MENKPVGGVDKKYNQYKLQIIPIPAMPKKKCFCKTFQWGGS